ncbi:fasciclin domain-containing protein [Candidatus Saccharibacteria bacterium]|nr:MAG: fasciclin domain-containing protein [Candidatus Saccharibacteria bacterium]
MNNNNDNNENKETTSKVEQPSQADQQQPGTIVTVASETPSLSTLVTAVKAASLVDTLQAEGPFTVFAPTNAAFDALPAGTVDTLLMPENVDQLKSILTYHVVSGKVMASDLKDGQEITTVQGGKLTVSISDGKAYVIDAKSNKVLVEKADVNAGNGVVHVIGGVLLPS